MWAGEDLHKHQGTGVIFVLAGALDTRDASLCLFPEILKSDLHRVRSTIEAYSRRGKLLETEQGTANGILVGSSNGGNHVFRVTTALGVAKFKIDRWD